MSANQEDTDFSESPGFFADSRSIQDDNGSSIDTLRVIGVLLFLCTVASYLILVFLSQMRRQEIDLREHSNTTLGNAAGVDKLLRETSESSRQFIGARRSSISTNNNNGNSEVIIRIEKLADGEDDVRTRKYPPSSVVTRFTATVDYPKISNKENGSGIVSDDKTQTSHRNDDAVADICAADAYEGAVREDDTSTTSRYRFLTSTEFVANQKRGTS